MLFFLRLLAKKCTIVFLFLFAAFSLIFIALEFIPGNALDLLLSESSGALEREFLIKELGLDKPFFERFISGWLSLFQGDWGRSYYFQTPVFDLVFERLQITLCIALIVLLLSVSIAVYVMSFVWKNPASASWIKLLTTVFLSQPLIFFAPVLVYIFSLKLRWTPVSGLTTYSHFILPVFCLVFFQATMLIRALFSYLQDLRSAEFIKVAYAKGLSDGLVYWRHCLKRMAIPLISLQTVLFSSMVTGSTLIEYIFDIPGLGLLLSEAFFLRDVPVIIGASVTTAFLYLICTALSDVLLSTFDPRVRA